MTGIAPGSLPAAQGEVTHVPYREIVTHVVKASAGVALAVLTIWLMAGHSSSDAIVALLRFWVFGITLPGTMLWRLATPFRHNLIEDFAAGAMVGASVLLLVYMAGAAVGLQQWAWLWAAPVLMVVVAVPTWRQRCLRRVKRPLSPTAAWLTAAACALPLYAVGRSRSLSPAPYTDARSNLPDMAFHQALAASAKYDFPLQAPYVNGERMNYHYFFHQFTAATSWATGVSLTDLIYNIGWIPLLLAGTALIFALTDRLAPGSRWAGPLAIAVATIGGTVNAYPNVNLPSESLAGYFWGSPTQNLGSGLVVLLALLGVDLLRGRSQPGAWLLFVLIGAAASGSKATVLPMIICGLGLVVVVRLCYGRFARGALLTALAFGGLFLAAIVVVFGGQSSGMAVRPWITFAKTGGLYPLIAKQEWGVFDHGAMWVTGITTCLGLTLGAAGLLVLTGTAGRWLRDPGMIFLVGIAIAGFGGMVLTDQPGASQLYFHRTAVPVIAALAAAGAWMLVFWFADRRSGILVFASVAAGVGATAAARAIVRAKTPPGQSFRMPDGQLTGLVQPWLWTIGLLLAAAVLIAGLWKLARRRGRPSRVIVASFVLAAMGAGLFLPLQAMTRYGPTTLQPLSDQYPLGPSATQTQAALWLKDNTAPGDLIATNAHCVMKNSSGCDARHFWISALSERHVLVEGWGYTNTINNLVASTGKSANGLPFWDEQRLQDNDQAFTSPTRDNLRLLKQKYGVHWLYADPGQTAVSHNLDALATLRFKAPDALVYELP
jgi:hypothetical protein